MYPCKVCQSQSAPGQKLARVVTATRLHTHPPVYDRVGVEVSPGGIGTQIVREVTAHPECVARAPVASVTLADALAILGGAA